MEVTLYTDEEWNEVLGVEVGAEANALLVEVTRWGFRLQRPVRNLERLAGELASDLGLDTPVIQAMRLGHLVQATETLHESLPPEVARRMLHDLGGHMWFLGALDVETHPVQFFTTHLDREFKRELRSLHAFKSFEIEEMVTNALQTGVIQYRTWMENGDEWLHHLPLLARSSMRAVVQLYIEHLALRELLPTSKLVRRSLRVAKRTYELCLRGNIPLVAYGPTQDQDRRLLLLTL